MSIDRELKTIELIESSSAIGYFFKRAYYSYFDFGKKYDTDLLNILDIALQTKRYYFIYTLSQRLKELNRLADTAVQKDVAQALAEEFKKHVQQTKGSFEDKGLRALKIAINHYYDAHGLGNQFRISKVQDLKSVDVQEKKKKRRNKAWLGLASFCLAFLVAVPEGALAVYGFGVFTLGPVLLFGLSAFSVSYFLYKSDLYNLFKGWVYPASESEESKKLFPVTKKILQFFVMFAAIAMGILLFSSIYVPAGMLIFGFTSTAALLAAPITPALAVLIGVSAFFASLTALANVALFEPICYKTYVGLKEGFQTFEWKELLTLKPLLLVASVAAMIFGQLWFGREAFNISKVMLGLSQNTSLTIAGVVGVLGILNGVFYGKNLYGFLSNVKDALFTPAQSTSKLIDHIPDQNNRSELRFFIYMGYLDSKRSWINLSKYSAIAVLVGCCVGNATGVATGVAALMGGYVALKNVAFWIISTSSFSANSKASYEAFSPMPSLAPALVWPFDTRANDLATPAKSYKVYRNEGTTGFEEMSLSKYKV